MHAALVFLCFGSIAAAGDVWVDGMFAAKAAQQRGDNAAAEQMLRALVREADAKGVQEVYPFALHDLAWVLHLQRRYDEAEPLYRRALSKTVEGSLRGTELRIQILNHLTGLYIATEQIGAAQRTLRALSSLPLAEFPNENFEYSTNLGTVQRLRGQLADAETTLRDALARAESGVGNEDYVAILLNGLGIVSERRGRLEQAVEFYQRSIAILSAGSGAAQLYSAAALSNLSEVYLKAGEFARAEEAASRALSILIQKSEPEDPMTSKAMLNRAAALRKLGRTGEAKPLEKKAKRIMASTRATSSAKALVDVADLR